MRVAELELDLESFAGPFDLLLALVLHRSDLPTPLALLPLALCWAVPGLLAVVQGRVLGRRGAHE